MAKNNATDPKKVVALSAGTIVALGFAAWRITEAVGPGGGGGAAPSAPAASAPAEAPAQPATAAEAPIPPELDRPAVALGQPGNSEETLALSADPFRSVAAPATLQIAAAPQPNVKEMPDMGSPGPLPPNDGHPDPATQPLVKTLPPAPPQLVGTLLGDSPSAVFKTEAGLQVVRRGGQIDAWKLVAVEHGGATVRHGKLSRQLTVNTRLGAIQVTERGSTAEAPTPEMMAATSGKMETMAEVPATVMPRVSVPVAPSRDAIPAQPEPAPIPESTPVLAPVDALPTDTPAPTEAPGLQPEPR